MKTHELFFFILKKIALNCFKMSFNMFLNTEKFKSLELQIKKKFLEKNSFIEYEEVVDEEFGIWFQPKVNKSII